MKSSMRNFFHALFQHKIDMLRFGRPNPEVRLTRRDQFRSDWIASSHPNRSPANAAAVVHISNFTLHRKIDSKHADTTE